MASILSKFFASQASVIAAQIALTRAQLGKAAGDDNDDAIERILAKIDFSGWVVLAGDIGPVLDELAKETGQAVLVRLGIDVEANADILNIVSAEALAYAEKRAAEMLGMRVDGLGRLVPNPNAYWQITEGTREGVRAEVMQALEEGWSNDKLADALADSYAFSDDRAMVIARTETQMAQQSAALDSYKASGVVDGKQWLTAEDDRVSDECQANGDAGPNGDGVLRDWDDAYPSGDAAPPAHPNCRCTLLPWFDHDARAESAPQLEEVEA